MSGKLPLNGIKTHPLKPGTIKAMRTLLDGPQPRNSFNPGTADRMERGDYVESVQLPSPYAVHKGAPISFLKLTDAGRAALKERE